MTSDGIGWSQSACAVIALAAAMLGALLGIVLGALAPSCFVKRLIGCQEKAAGTD